MIDDAYEKKKRDVTQIIETLQELDGDTEFDETDLDELVQDGLDTVSELRELLDTGSGSVTVIDAE